MKVREIIKWIISEERGPVLFRILLLIVGIMASIKFVSFWAGVILAVVGLLYELGYYFASEPEVKKRLDNLDSKVNELGRRITVPVEAVIPEKFTFLRKRLTKPIEVFVNEQISKALEHIVKKSEFVKGVAKIEDIDCGMVWIIRNCPLPSYAEVAFQLDHFITEIIDKLKLNGNLLSASTYIWSTNIIDPKKFPTNEKEKEKEKIIKHIQEANKLENYQTFVSGFLGVKGKGKIENKKFPSLLRLQLIKNDNETKFPLIQTKKAFENGVKKNPFFLKVFSPGLKIINISCLEDKPYLFLGDYIIYSNMLVLKWDEFSEVLYIMFGSEIVEIHKSIFISYLMGNFSQWDETSNYLCNSGSK